MDDNNLLNNPINLKDPLHLYPSLSNEKITPETVDGKI